MPHFTEDGREEWICQACGGIYDDRTPSEWRPDITGNEHASNVCPQCVKEYARLHPQSGKEKSHSIDCDYDPLARRFLCDCGGK